MIGGEVVWWEVGCGIFQPMRGFPIRRKSVEGGWMQTIEIVFLNVHCLKICKYSYCFMGVSIGGYYRPSNQEIYTWIFENVVETHIREVSILFYFSMLLTRSYH